MKKQIHTKKYEKIVVKPKRLAVATPKGLYETDFCRWTETQAKLLKNHKYSDLDIENLLEEIKSLGISDKRAIVSHLIILLLHLLKVKYQFEKKTKSWERSILNAQTEISLILKNNKSFWKNMPEFIEEAYPYARKKAALETKLNIETFPLNYPKEFLKDIPHKVP